ncbi:tryptophan 2,3-dioxygenase [Crucibulum laeve]|uniref:Tryptophan 2,3-dioxygenase n=1 Tax=Crucibulum laeve TaxID=68775 RepID=A0A5C3M6L6_9AGAR|nr:tryptophan 2,3-dioxygenase [Crucibulum laeve]
MDPILSNHFLALPRPDILVGPPAGVADTTTLAAHDFDVDNRTGFMPPQSPVARLPSEWEPWEKCLDEALAAKLELGDKGGVDQETRQRAERWRATVRDLPILPITELKKSEVLLRRAHHVLGWIMHFYIHSLAPDARIVIPAPITLPQLQVSAQLQLPPVLTYSDDVLYNWAPSTPLADPENDIPTIDNLRCQTLFTGTKDEEEFYLTSSRMELYGVNALELMRSMMDEAFVGDGIAARRITGYLLRLADVIKQLKTMLLDVRKGCDPDVFYHQVRPWFRGEDSDPNGRKWIWEGIEQDSTLSQPTELSGPSAGQSSLVHALDVFLGVDKYSHDASLTGTSSSFVSTPLVPSPIPAVKSAFLARMQSYMPRHHRNFLNHLANNPRPLRSMVTTWATKNPALLEAYNIAVTALKEFRDGHMIIVTQYIIAPARRRVAEVLSGEANEKPLKGTGGTELVRFLKGVRDQTKGALMEGPTKV